MSKQDFRSKLSWQRFYPKAHLSELQSLIEAREEQALQQCQKQGWPLDLACTDQPLSASWHCEQDTVVIQANAALTEAQQQCSLELMQALRPWKKGPFRIFGVDIDAEWRSELKWQRLQSRVGDLSGQKVADVGCNNGYFMFRILEAGASHVLGLEPFFKHWYSFRLLQQMLHLEQADLELLGVEHIDRFPEQFDTIFCLGILYHHTDPIGMLRKMKSSLVRGGKLWIDCQGIPGDEPVALVPSSRYAGARGIWFLPTLACLKHWIRRAGFQSIEEVYSAPLSVEEQRRTDWAPIRSLQDFLDPQDPSKTVEGYAAPWRFYLLVR